MQVSAAGFAQKVSLTKSNADLLTVLNELKQQSGYIFLYTDNVLKSANPVTVKMNQVDFKTALDEVFKNQPLSYTITDNAITIRAKEPTFLDRVVATLANDDGKFADIRGVVRNERGEALEGITVMVKGAKTGTRTNAKGEFVLKGVKKGDVLVFTGVAIEPFEYTVKDDKNIDLNLKARLVQLEEVGINTGYQKISKERFVGSYSQLDSAAFHRRAGMGILERLDGTTTGIWFNKKDSSNPIQIRGISTLYNTQNPLIIVDNFPFTNDLNSINPNDIENIVILKDAAATSIWGARAGNGVIVITTKKARYNQPMKVFMNTNITLNKKPNLFYYPQMSSSDFIDVERFLFEKGFYSTKLDDIFSRPVISPVVEILDQIKRGELSETIGNAQINQMKNVDLRKQLDEYVYQNGLIQQHYLDITGGSSKTNYKLSIGYNNHRPNLQHSKSDDLFTVTSKVSIRPIDKLEINTGISLSQNTGRSADFNLDQLYQYQKIVDENRNAVAVPRNYRKGFLDTVGNGQLLDWGFRPIDEIKNVERKSISRLAIFNLGLSYRITKWLNANVDAQYRLNLGDNKNAYGIETFMTRNLINLYTNLNSTNSLARYPIPKGSIIDIRNDKTNTYNLRSQLNFNHEFTGNHVLTGMISSEISDESSFSNSNRFYGYDPSTGSYQRNMDYASYYTSVLGFGSEQIPNNNLLRPKTTNRIISLIGNVSYTLQNKYTLYGSARRDGTNVFGINTNNKWKPLWSIGTGWDISKESFFKIKWISFLKFRASHGYSGNVNNTQSALTTIQYSSSPAQFTGLTYAQTGFASNPDLRWEEVNMINMGLDFALLRDRVSGSLEYFYKKSTDLISSIPLAPTTGLSSYPINSASLNGNGIDLKLSARITNRKLKWDLNYGLSYARIKVTKISLPNLYTARDFVSGFGLNPALGRIVFGVSSYKWGGLDPLTGDPQGYLNGELSKDYIKIFTDSVDHQTFHGSSIPLYSGFLGNSVTYRNFTLSVNINYSLDFYYRKPSINYTQLFNNSTGHVDYLSRWQNPGDELRTNVPSMIYPLSSNQEGRDQFYSASEVNTLRGDNIRVQDLRLQYSFNSIYDQRSTIKSMTIFAYLNNLNFILWKKDKSAFDPDFVGGSNFLAPTPKSFTFGINLSL